jgi:hypothetical protein
MTRHCHRCGWEWSLRAAPGRSETCPSCRADLKVCLNCAFFDLRAAHQCRERRAEPVEDKATANFCEYFEFALRDFRAAAPDSREDSARDSLKRLLGD